MRVIGYVRVSTQEQASTGVSLDVQAQKLRKYCELHELTLLRIEADEGVSAKTLDRPGLTAALDMLRTGEAAGLLVAKLDRLSRSVADWDKLITGFFGEAAEAKSQLFSVADSIDTRTAAGRLVLNVLMSVAQWERETIAERVREAMAHQKSRGHRVGQIPYGRRLVNPTDPEDTRMENHPEERRAIAAIVRMRRFGFSLRQIAQAMTETETPTKSGRPRWSAGSVRSILARYKNGPNSDAGPELDPLEIPVPLADPAA